MTGGSPNVLRERLSIPSHATVVGQLGALDLNKGTNDLVNAVLRINRSSSSNRRVHLLLAGGATPRFNDFLASLPADSLESISLLGRIAESEVPDFYASLDIYAMPSRTDSFGIVFLEAWANAKPVIAAAAGGVVEVVEHEQTGLLVEFGDVEQLSESIQRLVDHPNLASLLGRNGFQQVKSGCTWDDRYQTLETWMNRFLEERGTQRVSTSAGSARPHRLSARVRAPDASSSRA